MRYFVDCEFNGFGGQLISIAAVPETEGTPAFYQAMPCPDPLPWISERVLPVLETEPRPAREVAYAFADYLSADGDALLVADWPEDIAHAARLIALGSRRLVVSRVRFELMAVSSFSTDVLSDVPHNAYHDAVALRRFTLAHEANLAGPIP